MTSNQTTQTTFLPALNLNPKSLRRAGSAAAFERRAMLLALLTGACGTIHAQPANDNFADRIVLTGASIAAAGSSVGATRESGEPGEFDSVERRRFINSVWWTWTAPTNGLLTVTSAGSDFNTMLAVYTGSTLTNLVEVAYSDASLSGRPSRVAFHALSNIPYQIAVGGGEGGIKFNLSFSPPPPNDDFTNRIDLGSANVKTYGDNTAATSEPGEPSEVYDGAFHSVWWSWMAPASGPLTITAEAVAKLGYGSIPGGPFIGLSVFTGSSLRTLSPVASQPGYPPLLTSQVTFGAQAGMTYQISVSGLLGVPGAFTLNVAQTTPPIVILTDPSDNADYLSGSPIAFTAQAFDADGTVQRVDFYLDEQAIGTVTNRPFSVTVSNVMPKRYTLRAAATDDLGAVGQAIPVSLNVRPFNDDFVNRVPLSGAFLTATGWNANATREPGEPPSLPANADNSIWWSWTAPASTITTIALSAGFGYWPSLQVFTGSSLTDLVLITNSAFQGNDPTYSTHVAFPAGAGKTYQIAAATLGGADYGRPVTLNIAMTAPPTVAITSPTNHARFITGDTITIAAEAISGDGTMARIDLYRDSGLFATLTNPPYSITLTANDAGPTSHNLEALVTDAYGITASSEEVSYSVYPPPPTNDDFARRIPLSGSFLSITGTLAWATGEIGETVALRGHSVWWSWTAPASGPVTCTLISDFGFSPALGVFTGSVVTNLILIAYDGYGGQNDSYSTQVNFDAVAGTSYAIGAGTYGDGGRCTLSIAASAPPVVTITTPPDGSAFPAGTDITITAEATDSDGTVAKVDFYRSPGVILATVTNSPFSLTLSNAGPNGFEIEAVATDNQGVSSRPSLVRFFVNPTPLPPPVNDDFADRILFTGSFVTVTGTLANATMETGEPAALVWWSWKAPATALFTLTLTFESGYLPSLQVYTGSSLTNLLLITNHVVQATDFTLSTRVVLSAVAGANYEIGVGASAYGGLYALSVAQGFPPSVTITSPLDGATVKGSNYVTISADAAASDGRIVEVDFYLSSGGLVATVTNAPYSFDYPLQSVYSEYYRVQAAATDDRGLTTFSSFVSFLAYPPPPPNDAFANRSNLSGFYVLATGSTAGATAEPGEANLAGGPDGGSVWWAWTAPASGTAIITGQGYDSSLSVFTGSSVSDLTPLVTGPPPQSLSPSFQVSFPAVAGTTYQLAGESLSPSAGDLVFSLFLDARQFSQFEHLEDGTFRFRFASTPGPTWIIEASTNLVDWISLATNSAPDGLFEFVDSDATKFQRRFYRSVMQP